MKVLNLLVLSRHQTILDGFISSILPTIDDDVKIYAISEGLNVPEDPRIILVGRTEFNPNKYFNIIRSMIPEADRGYVGIVNDDIRFSSDWLSDVREKLEKYNFVSPGFIETSDCALFQWACGCKNDKGVVEGQFDAFFIFDWMLFSLLGDLDESIIDWYDIYLFLKAVNAGFFPVTSKKVTVMHFGSASFSKAEKDLKGIRSAIVEKYGISGLKSAKDNSNNLRRYFSYV